MNSKYRTKLHIEPHKNVAPLVLASLFSTFIMHLSTGLKILDPRHASWLSILDGRSEISWEYFRRTPFPNWLSGDLYLYGMESTKPLFYSTTPPLYALILRPFSIFFSDRFQFLGLMILLNLILIYFIAFKIFSFLSLNSFFSNAGAVLILISPVTLHRFIDQTHYVLTANWLILLAIYFVLKKSQNSVQWSLLISGSLMIHTYYFPMILVLYLTWIAFCFFNKKAKVNEFLKVIFFTFFLSSLGLSISGFFRDVQSASFETFGYYKTNLTSLFNSDGWSKIIPPLSKSSGDYEGFGFPGISFFLILLFTIWYLIKAQGTKKRLIPNYSFLALWTSSILLFIFSLSGNIDFLDTRLLTLFYPDFIGEFISLFRATGRFIWVLSYVFMISVFAYLFTNLAEKTLISVLLFIFILCIQIYDTYPKFSSQKYVRFLIENKFNLESSFWDDINLCYEAVNSVPAHKFSSHAYELSTKLSVNNVGIYPAFSARDSVEEVQFMIKDMRDDLKLGNYDPKRLYVFQDSKYATTPKEIKLDKRIALGTMSDNSRAAEIDGLLIIAPEFENCKKLHKNYKNIFTIKNNNLFSMRDEILKFGADKKTNDFLVEGWSPPEKWGVWSNSERASLIFKASQNQIVKEIILKGNFFEPDSTQVLSYKIEINKKNADYSIKKLNNQTNIHINVFNSLNNNGVFLLDFLFSDLSSPKDNNLSEDTRLLGYALKEIQIIYEK